MQTREKMYSSMHAQELLATTPCSEANVAEMDLLAQWSFTAEEIISLLWLRQWYQTGGSDRATIVRYLEFLRFLVRSGELEL
jgi:hypothetical protein